MATTTVTQVIENFYKLPLLAIKTAKSTPGSNEETPKEKDVFLLKCRSYYDLRAYLFAGMTLPSTSDAFERLYPPSNCKKLTEVDAGIYEKTKTTFLDIYKSCEKFNREDMGYITQIAGNVQTFSRTAIFLLEGNKLKGQIEILLREEYADESNRDKLFEDSKKACKTLLEGLRTAASSTAEKIGKVITRLEGFQGETNLNENAVSFLVKEYKEGPVVDSSTGKAKLDANGKPFKPYAKYINEELENMREQLRQDIKRRDDEYDNWNHYTVVAATAVTYAWCPLACGVVMGIYSDKAIKANAAYNEYKAKVEKDNADIATLNALSTNITSLCIQFDDIGKKIEAAKTALVEIKSLFQKQSENFEQAVTMFGLAEGSLNEELYLRKLMLEDSLKNAVDSFQKVIHLAEDFQNTQFAVEKTSNF